MLTAEQVCVQLRTSADNVELPAYAAARRVAADRQLAGRAAIDRYFMSAGSTAATPQQRCADGIEEQTDGRTDARQLHRPFSA